MDESHPLDATVTATAAPLDPDLLGRTLAVAGVAEAVRLPGTFAAIGGEPVTLVAVDERPGVVRGPDDLAPADGEILLPYDVVRALPDRLAGRAHDGRITVIVGGREHELDVVLDDGWGRAGIVSTATLDAILDATGATSEPMAVWVRARDGADAEDLSGDLAALAAPANAELSDGWSDRAWVDLQVDVMTGAVVGLLAVAIVIALVGIANTLGLSVLERGRENALLRAMGLTRRQLRRAMAAEGLLLSGVATVMGIALGVAFAWVGVQVLIGSVVDDASLTVPVWQVGTVALVAALAGLAACVVPARRAARVAPAAGLALD
jgi:putative ABC transport system permease protein